MSTEGFIADKATIRAELEKRARARQTITYGEASVLVGLENQGLGKILTAIKAEETGRRRPDLGCLVVTVRTGLPSYVGQETMHGRRRWRCGKPHSQLGLRADGEPS